MPEQILVLIIIFAALMVQSITGFGFALVSMPLIVPLLGIKSAASLVAIIAFALECALVLIYRKSLNVKAVFQLTIASLIAIPIGVALVKIVDERVVVYILGLVIICYSIYALLKFRLPSFEKPVWAYIFGAIAGILGGAYNTNGPPIIIYGTSKKWEPDQFKANLQGFFFVNNILIIFSHLAAKNATGEVWTTFFLAIPLIVLAVWLGTTISKRIDPSKFRIIILILLLVLGIKLLF